MWIDKAAPVWLNLRPLRGRLPKWPTGADCKSAGLRLRWFESITYHHFSGCSPEAERLLIPFPAQPEQALENETVLGFAGKRGGKLFVGLMLVVDIVVAHVEINHAIALVGPDDWIITLVPDFVRFGSGSERETGGINGEQDRDIGVRSQIVAPFVPLVRSGFEDYGQVPGDRMLTNFDAEDG